MENYSAQQLQDRLAASAQPPLLLDVREPWEFERCHIAGSVLIPMRQIPRALADLDENRETVVICHHGIRSRHVAMMLERAGFRRVINLAGGIDGWAREVDPHMPVY